jgi:hypothetical protein
MAGGVAVPVVHVNANIETTNAISDQLRNTVGRERKTQTFHTIDVVVCSAASAHLQAFLIVRMV